MIEVLEETLKWIRVTSIPHVKKLLSDTLPSDHEKIAYHYSDGRASQEVSKVAGASYVTITKWWKIWIRSGIAESLAVKGGERARRIFSLEDFGIEVPTPENAPAERSPRTEPVVEEGSTQEKTFEEEKK